MKQDSPAQLFRRYALPQMAGLLFNSVYFIVDGVFIGNRLGRDALAAAAVSVPVIEVLIALALALTGGASILIGRSVGQRKAQNARRVFALSLLMTLVLGVCTLSVGLFMPDRLARLLGATPDIMAPSVAYLRYILLFSPFLLLSFVLGGLVRTDGRPRLAMVAMIIGSLSNVLLDYVFMYPLNMGITGAALATGLGPVLSVLILLPHFLMRRGQLYLSRVRLNLREAGQLLLLGFPGFILEFTIGMLTLLHNLAILRQGYGELGLAAYLLIGYLMLMMLTVFLGLAEGLQPVFAYLHGAKQGDRLLALRRYALKVVTVIGVLLSLAIVLFSGHFYRLFAPGDAALTTFAATQSRWYFGGLFAAGLNILLIIYWQSTGQSLRALYISLLRCLVLPALLLFAVPDFAGRTFIWMAHSLSELLTAAAALLLLRYKRKASLSPMVHRKAASS